MTKIVVLLPTYNEAENLAKMVHTLLALPIEGLAVLVIDDNSPDGTGQIADDLTAEFPDRVGVLHRAGKEGLGKAYKAGIRQGLAMGADIIVQMDCDFSHPPDRLPAMIDAIQGGHDVVIGSRYIAGGSLDSEWGWWRKLVSWWANRVYIHLILRMRVRDATGGYRAWTCRALQSIDLDLVHSNGYIFLAEMAYVAERLGYHIHEVPIHFAERQEGTSKMNLDVQIEAAFRVWQVLFRHHGLTAADRVTITEGE